MATFFVPDPSAGLGYTCTSSCVLALFFGPRIESPVVSLASPGESIPGSP